VLVYLEGLTAEQVARQLGWPPGTVRSRLARGRERLRARLVRRGVAPSAAALVAALAADSAWATVPATLANVTTRAAVHVAAGRVAAGIVPASILTLTVRGTTAIQARLDRVEQTLADLLGRVKKLEDHAFRQAETHPYRSEAAK